MSARRVTLLILTAALVLPQAAYAATKHGITPTSPKAGSTVPVGSTPTYKGKFRGKGPIYVNVCASRKKDKDGLICLEEDGQARPGADIGKAKKKGKRFSYKPTFFDFPEFYLNTPGTYYWQAHRIACEHGNIKDCNQEGPIVKFKVG
jgi:hypothetical protein